MLGRLLCFWMDVGDSPDNGEAEVVPVGVGMWQVSGVQLQTGEVGGTFESEEQRYQIGILLHRGEDWARNRRFRVNFMDGT